MLCSACLQFLSLCPSRGLPWALVSLSGFFMHFQDQPHHSPQGCPGQPASVLHLQPISVGSSDLGRHHQPLTALSP